MSRSQPISPLSYWRLLVVKYPNHTKELCWSIQALWPNNKMLFREYSCPLYQVSKIEIQTRRTIFLWDAHGSSRQCDKNLINLCCQMFYLLYTFHLSWDSYFLDYSSKIYYRCLLGDRKLPHLRPHTWPNFTESAHLQKKADDNNDAGIIVGQWMWPIY